MTFKPGAWMRHYAHDDIAWGYRMCGLPRNEIVLEATLKLAPGSKADIRTKMEQALTRRRHTQPVGAPPAARSSRTRPTEVWER